MRDTGTTFAADRFSAVEPKFTLCSRHTEQLVRQIVAENYASLGDISNVSQIGDFGIEDIGRVDANSLNFKLGYDAGVALLKVVLRFDVLAELDRQVGMCRWLAAAGIPAANVIPSDGGTDLIELDVGIPCKAYLQTFVDGNYFSGAASEIAPVATAIGELMMCLTDLPDHLQLRRSRPAYFEDRERKIFSYIREMRSRWPDVFGPENAVILEASWDRVAEAFAEVTAAEAQLCSMPQQVTHYDLHPHNMLLANSKITAFLDFDACYRIPAEIGIGFAASKLLKRIAVARRENSRQGTLYGDACCFFDALHRSNPKHASERPLLRLCAKAETLRRLISVCSRSIAGKEQVWHGLETHAPALEEIDLLFQE